MHSRPRETEPLDSAEIATSEIPAKKHGESNARDRKHLIAQGLSVQKPYPVELLDASGSTAVRVERTTVMAALAVGHELEHRTGLSLRPSVRSLTRYRACELDVNGQITHTALCRYPRPHLPDPRNLTNLAQVGTI